MEIRERSEHSPFLRVFFLLKIDVATINILLLRMNQIKPVLSKLCMTICLQYPGKSIHNVFISSFTEHLGPSVVLPGGLQ